MIDTRHDWPLLIEFGEGLINAASIQNQSSIIVNFLQEVFDCRAYVLLFENPGEIGSSRSWIGNNLPKTIQELMVDVAYSQKARLINELNLPDVNTLFGDILDDSVSSQDLEKIQAQTLNALVTSIYSYDHVFGACMIVRASHSNFTQHEAEFLEFLAFYTATICHSNIKESDDRNKSDLLNLVRDVSAHLTHLDNLDDLSERIVKLIQTAFDYYYVALFTVEDGAETLCFRKSAGKVNSDMNVNSYDEKELENHQPSPKIDVQIGQGIIGKVAQNGNEIIANDVSRNPDYRHEDLLPQTKSEAALPIKIADKILGVLDIQSDQSKKFQAADLLVLRGLSDNIAVAIENSRLYIDIKKHLTQLHSIYDVSNAITSILKFDDLLEQVISLMQLNLGYSSVHFYTFNPANGEIIYQKGGIGHQHLISSYDYQLHLSDEHSPVSWVARNKTHLIIGDLSKETDFYPTAPEGKKACSELLVPLMFADQLLGVLEILSDQPDYFTDDDLFIVEALADNIAIALRNSNLYRSEQWRRQVADSLREVAGLLSADISLEQVLASILDELIKTLPSIAAVIWLLDETYGESDDIPELRLSALKWSTDYLAGYEQVDFNFEEILGLSIDDLINTYGLDGSVKLWLFEAISSKDPIIRDSGTPYEPVGTLLNLNSDHSAIATPLRIGERTLGVLTLIHDRFGRYGQNSELLSATFANYAAVAIENTRLYEAAHDQAWVSTVLLQVAQAMQSIDSVDELLETIVQILPDLIGANSCAILLWDEDTDTFFPGMASGFTSDQLVEFENWYIAKFEVTAFDKTRETKSPVLIGESDIPPSMADTLFRSFDFVNGLYMLFPMITQNEVIGVIFVDFREDDDQFSGEVTLWEEKISIIQGVANQSAIAIENIQLIQAQEEEAYISVALLQVAQAVVNSNTLDEVLSAIVRITPILIGVRRSAIFLWDVTHNIYRTTQTYGFSRDELADMQPFYSPDEFQFLDSVQKNNKLVYYQTINPIEPKMWANLSRQDLLILENQIGNIEVGLQQENLFQSKYPLLMGIPLAVKDNVLGIMLIEESDTKSSIPSAHVREKRLEIVTGITQQAAIAIQNDTLQREVLERERLEREMQLAREIQSTFLPDHLPKVEGWDLDVRWRPARQVGGDFYDVFELPNNQLGIVIADVADKGMPAALYMTLVRTLIRAAVHDLQSPKEVLRRVNNLLVPDSRQGMFVTLVYAVLSIDTGLLIYSNAGHNPPLSRKVLTGKITEHARDAMALGVYQDITINESVFTLDPGDLFLLYTDGITEAFSSIDEIFGVERLKEVIQNSNFDSAASLLNLIEASVLKFSNGLSQSDDVTLVALFRRSN